MGNGVLASDRIREITRMHEKFTEFFKRYESFMYRIANNVLKDSYEAEDAVQIAFLKMYNNFQGIGDIESSRTKHFVSLVTRRAAIDLYRRQKRQNSRQASYEGYEKEASTKSEEMILEDNEVMECIERLPPRYADTLLLRYVQGYKTKEIAELLGYAPGTIRCYIFRGKKLLREELKKSGIDISV